jgi:branched-chain amino acid transport system substrate-binding protein
VRAELGKMKIDDFFAKGGQIRKDGLLIHDMYLLTVKQGGESKWDVANVTATIPGKDAYVAEADSGCALDAK